MTYETTFLIALALTSVIEVPLVYILVRFIFRLKKVGAGQILLVAFIASLLTLPYLWFVIPSYIDARNSLFVGEVIVVLIEMIIYNRLLGIKIEKSLIISIVANVASYFIGLQIIKILF